MTLETMPQEWKDRINEMLEECPETVTGLLIHMFSESKWAVAQGGTIKYKQVAIAMHETLGDAIDLLTE